MPDVATVDVTKALAIKGYMEPPELEWLAQTASESGRIAEIGSYYGRSTRAICDHAKGKVHAYDDFWGPRDVPMDYRTRLMIRGIFDENLKEHLESGKLVVHDEDHADVQPDGLFDFIFIDGSHDYFDFKRDLEKWIQAVSAGGIVSGHDYDLAFPGVLRAVAEVFGSTQVTTAPNTTIWYARAK